MPFKDAPVVLKAQRTLAAVIPNDRQIFRIVMEKAPPPWQAEDWVTSSSES